MRALLSVSDKTGIVEFASRLSQHGFSIVSTGGTYDVLRQADIVVSPVADITGFPEILDGRVKTLHPSIHGAILARRDLPEHTEQLAQHEITPIDLVVVNLYPFEATIAQPGVSADDAIEQIDIGGPAMARAAAKNFAGVIVVTNPHDYDEVIHRATTGADDQAWRRSLAAKAFAHVATYDSLVASYLVEGDDDFPTELSIGLRHERSLRYGENPQQAAAAYRQLTGEQQGSGVLDATVLHGKELSFNNLLDADAAWQAARIQPERPTVAIVKHNLACGLASRNVLAEAFAAAFAGDPISAFGGIVCLNRPVDTVTAEALNEVFFEVIIAPAFDEEALSILTRKKNVRLLALASSWDAVQREYDVRPIHGGLLLQHQDNVATDVTTWECVTVRQPTEHELRDLAYAWEAARLAKSNAIALAVDSAIVGIGAGQPNRLESVDIAVRKAGQRAHGAALASDAFFPFADGVERAIHEGVTAIVQPGGSVRDKEVVEAANRAGAAMVFTRTRHFRH